MLLAHAGNRVDLTGRVSPRFPASLVPAVRAAVRSALVELRPSAVVTAAAAGADLVVLEEAVDLGIPIHVVLPLPVTEFRERSVADAGEPWNEAYDRIVRLLDDPGAGSLRVVDCGDAPDWYLVGNERILQAAETVAAEKDTCVFALVVRPHGGNDPPSATDHFATIAAGRGHPVVEIPIMAPR